MYLFKKKNGWFNIHSFDIIEIHLQVVCSILLPFTLSQGSKQLWKLCTDWKYLVM